MQNNAKNNDLQQIIPQVPDDLKREQYLTERPEEYPSMPVKSKICQIEPLKSSSGFEKFNFEEDLCVG